MSGSGSGRGLRRVQPAKELQPGDVIAGKFRLERVIGRGGMGAVWAARHAQLDMPVALKFIDAEADEKDARVRFEREARAAGQLRSPHVVQIIDHGIDGDRPYIAMELLEGEDLGERLRREGRLSVAATAKILTQAAKALRRAHDAGIIHRDLKPGNVFLARFDEDEVVKILDFGVAKMRDSGAIDPSTATQTGIVFGSPSYMSPEQARGVRSLDHRSDLWSLAVILFRTITGQKPFQAASIGDLVIKLCIDPLPVATAYAPDLPPAVDAFFSRAFARDPEQRFGSAVEMAAAFEAIAAGADPPKAGGALLTVAGRGAGGPAAGATAPQPAPVAAAAPPATAPAQPATPSPDADESQPHVDPVTLPPAAPRPAEAAPVFAAPPFAPPPAMGWQPPAAPAPYAAPAFPGGSGAHVAFASGTLTPPSGAMAASGNMSASGGWGMVPSSSGPMVVPQIAPAEQGSDRHVVPAAPVDQSSGRHVVPAAPVEQGSGPYAAPAAPVAQGSGTYPVQGTPAAAAPNRLVVIAAALGASAFVLLVLVLFIVTRSRPPDAVGNDPAPTLAAAPEQAESPAAANPTTTAPPAATPAAAPEPSAQPAATAAPEPSAPAEPTASASASAAPAPSAEPVSEPTPKAPRAPTKPGKKKKPNFGY